MIQRKNKFPGFTLIETLIYIVLFSIIIGGGMIAAYQIVEGTERTESKTILEQDANFILRKINWVLTGAISVDTSGTVLNVDSISFALTGPGLTMNGFPLNSSRVKISGSFQIITDLVKPKKIITTFTATSSDGKISQQFTSTKYLRQ